MAVVINTNFAATAAANNLAASNSSLQRSLNRLSSGSKVVNPADDAGGLAVSMKLSAAARRAGADINNKGNLVSKLQTTDGALKITGKVLERMSELTTLYSDATKSTGDKANYNLEFASLQTELTTIGNSDFNGIALFSASDLNGTSGVSAVTGLATGLASTTAASVVQTAISNVATLRATNGAAQSSLGFDTELATVNKANLEAANSRIMDVDVAEESTQLARWNVLVSAGTAMLAQANQSAQSVMRLLQ